MFALAAAIVAILVLCGVVDGGPLPDSLWWWLMFIAFAFSPVEMWLRGQWAQSKSRWQTRQQTRRRAR